MMKRNKVNKKVLVLLSALALTLFSCGEARGHISLFVYSGEDTFMKGYSNQIVESLKDKFEVKMFDGESSQTYQNSQIVSEIEDESSKVLLINLVDRLSASTVIEKAASVNRPIIFLNREPLERDLAGQKLAYYVGAKPESEGELQAKIVNEYFKSNDNFIANFDRNKNKKVDVILIKGEQGHQDTENRSKYSIDTLKSLGYDVNILDASFCDWSREMSLNHFKEIYDEFKDSIDLILSNNDDMALGVIDYLKTLEEYDPSIPLYEEFYPIIGVDATEYGVEAIRNKEMYGTVQNDYETQVEIIVTLIDYLLANKDMSDFPYEMDKENYFHTNGIALTQLGEGKIK